jgi:outer membrane lipoprotein-sorting protein
MVRRLCLCALLLAALPAAAQSQAASEGRALLEKLLQADGGVQRLRGIYAYRQKQRVQVQGAKGTENYSWDMLVAFPDRMHLEMTSDSGQQFTIIASPAGAFFLSGETSVDLAAATAGSWEVGLRRNPFYIAQHLDDGGVKVAMAGTDTIGGATLKILQLTIGADVLRLWVDARTLRPLRYSIQVPSEKGPKTQMIEPSDLRRVDGIQFAFHILVTEEGRQVATNDVEAVELNPEVDPRLFYRKPLALHQVAFRPGVVTAVPLRANATLRVVSQPHGAQLYLDDVPKGVTSENEGRLVLEDVDPGSHRVRLTIAGYKEWTKTVSPDSGDDLAIEATLDRAGPAPFSEADIEQMLSGGVSAKRTAVLVKERGVDFLMDDPAEQRLRAAGADGDLLLTIAKAKR